LFQSRYHFVDKPVCLKLNTIRKPLMVHTRGIDRLSNRHSEIDNVDHNAENGVDDRSTARTASDEDRFSVAS